MTNGRMKQLDNMSLKLSKIALSCVIDMHSMTSQKMSQTEKTILSKTISTNIYKIIDILKQASNEEEKGYLVTELVYCTNYSKNSIPPHLLKKSCLLEFNDQGYPSYSFKQLMMEIVENTDNNLDLYDLQLIVFPKLINVLPYQSGINFGLYSFIGLFQKIIDNTKEKPEILEYLINGYKGNLPLINTKRIIEYIDYCMDCITMYKPRDNIIFSEIVKSFSLLFRYISLEDCINIVFEHKVLSNNSYDLKENWQSKLLMTSPSNLGIILSSAYKNDSQRICLCESLKIIKENNIDLTANDLFDLISSTMNHQLFERTINYLFDIISTLNFPIDEYLLARIDTLIDSQRIRPDDQAESIRQNLKNMFHMYNDKSMIKILK